MIALERTAAVLLCGGHSRRFEAGDKLLYPLENKPLVAHIAGTLASLPLLAKVATVRPGATALQALLAGHGFAIIAINADDDQPQSLQSGLEAALAVKPDAILLALGDMPFVTHTHVAALAHVASHLIPAASKGDGWLGPPWIASSSWVAQNRTDMKQALRHQAIAVEPSSDLLADIDRLEDLPPL
jgi:molybdenum cofactor cytidylyltransferase